MDLCKNWIKKTTLKQTLFFFFVLVTWQLMNNKFQHFSCILLFDIFYVCTWNHYEIGVIPIW